METERVIELIFDVTGGTHIDGDENEGYNGRNCNVPMKKK